MSRPALKTSPAPRASRRSSGLFCEGEASTSRVWPWLPERVVVVHIPCVLPAIRGSLPEVIRSWCAHHHHQPPPPKVFAGRLNARGTRTRLPRRAGGAWPTDAPVARDLGAAATPLARRPLAMSHRTGAPLARRPLAMSHRTGAPLERGGGGGSKVLAVCHPSLDLGRSSKHALHRASRAARSARRHRHPHHPQKTTCAVTRGAHVGARARSAPAFGAERVARGSDPVATGARARSAHAIGAELVTRGDAGSQCAAALSGCPTVPPAPSRARLGGSCLLAQL